MAFQASKVTQGGHELRNKKPAANVEPTGQNAPETSPHGNGHVTPDTGTKTLGGKEQPLCEGPRENRIFPETGIWTAQNPHSETGGRSQNQAQLCLRNRRPLRQAAWPVSRERGSHAGLAAISWIRRQAQAVEENKQNNNQELDLVKTKNIHASKGAMDGVRGMLLQNGLQWSSD